MDKNKLAEEYAQKVSKDLMIAEYGYEKMRSHISTGYGPFVEEHGRTFSALFNAVTYGFDAAESIANAKIQELEEKLKDGESSFLKVIDWNENLQKICNDKDAINTGLNAVNKNLISKITELEQKLKNSISIDAHLEWKREWEQQLKKAESMLKELDEYASHACFPVKPDGCTCGLGKIRQYLKSRGE